MRIPRFVRTLMIAGPTAVLSILSLASAVMAVTGGADWPRYR